MLSIHLTKPPSQGAKPHCAPTGLSLRGCGRPEAMTLAVCAKVFLGRTSDHSIPWQQEASLPGTAQAPFLTGDGGWQEHGPGTSKPHLRKHTRETPRAGPAPRPARPPPPPRNPPLSRHPPAPLPLCSWQVPAVAAALLLHLSGAGPAPAQRTPSGRWLQGKGRVTTSKGQAHDQQLPGRTTPRPHLTPAGSGPCAEGL